MSCLQSTQGKCWAEEATVRSIASGGTDGVGIVPSPSHDSKRQQRKKPLAIAVGYNYAEDMRGRPVVITPGSRRPAVDIPRAKSQVRGANQSSPSSFSRTSLPLGDGPLSIPMHHEQANQTPLRHQIQS